MEIKDIAKEWYYKLGFPSNYDIEFEYLLQNNELSSELTIDNYDTKEKDGGKNLLYYLYFCEHLSQKYKEKGIPENILVDTVSDIVTWTKTWSNLKGELYLGEIDWLKRHLGMKLFRLGRLQFCIAKSEFEISECGLLKGNPVIEVHIPEGESLSREACVESLDMAREFFAKYFPEIEYTVFTCHSWLLDETLGEFLSEGSNILKFADLFTIVAQHPSNALLRYIFRWDRKREQLEEVEPPSSFAKRIKDAAMQGKEFHQGLGYINK